MNIKKLKFDVAVIGAGPAGYSTAISLAQRGKKVLCVDENNLGGECLNHGCIPSKAFLKTAKTFHSLQGLSLYGIKVENPSFDMGIFQSWKQRRIVKKLSSGIGFLFKTKGVEFLKGKAFFIDKNSIRVMTEEGMNDVWASNIVIATGSKTKLIPGLEPDGKTIFTPKEILDIDFLPESVTIIGGGYIGLEIGFFFLFLGKKVNVIESMDNILGDIDDDLRFLVEDSFKKLGGEIHTSSTFKAFSDSKITFGKNGEDKTIDSQIVLVSVGRDWDFKPLRLHKLEGIKFNDDGSLFVKEKMETNITGVFAVGDCTGGPLLAHKAFMEAMTASEAIISPAKQIGKAPVVPYTIFTEPEIAYVGLTEKEAEKQNITFRIGNFPNSALGINNIIGNKIGFTKILVNETDGKIIGAKIAGENASNLIAEFTIAIEKGFKINELADIVHVHPSQSEAVQESALTVFKRSIHY